MIEAWSEKIAVALHEADEQKAVSVAVMKFALITLLNIGITLLLVVIIGLVDGKLPEVLAATGCVMLLRMISGAGHLKSADLCVIVSTFFLSLIPFVHLNTDGIRIATGIACVLAALFAPYNIKGATRIPEKFHPWLKPASVLLISLNFLLGSNIIAVSFLVQTIHLIPLKRDGLKRR